MIYRYKIGNPIETTAVPAENAYMFAESVVTEHFFPGVGEADSVIGIDPESGKVSYEMTPGDRVFGLGQAVRGINKRGWIYESFCSDDPHHEETKHSLYGAHNFIIVQRNESTHGSNAGSGRVHFGLFIDNPGKVTFDIGYNAVNELKITQKYPDSYIYYISGDSLKDIVHQFRTLIGRSYIPPKWAFGYGQSRWGYRSADDIREVVRRHKEAGIPLDMVYLDIDYMDEFRDFTINSESFPEFGAFVQEMKDENIHLIPIIDAGVKVDDGYDIYEEGVREGHFTSDKDGNPFVAAVWPGRSVFPDFINSSARRWFGDKYNTFLDAGIDGFWNDMNEPALFYSPGRLEDTIKKIGEMSGRNIGIYEYFKFTDMVAGLQNSPEDYESMYHRTDSGETVCHDRVHNIYGMKMTEAAAEVFKRRNQENDILIFSRASYIGAHRYGGIWQGDNKSWWQHLRLNIAMTANLGMCGFLFTGADIGGFGNDVTEELLLRWLAFGIFTPLMRNHSALGTREQEVYRFENVGAFRHIIGLRYKLMPYIYKSYVAAAENNEMLFRPLSFDYEADERTYDIEDQLMFGESMMIAPVTEQNTAGRMVYLPEAMTMVRYGRDDAGEYLETQEEMAAGDHYITVPVDEVVIFLKNDSSR